MIGKPASASTVDVLAFWGAVFSGIITLVGVGLTIRFSQGEIELTINQQSKEQFIKGFGSIVLEINSITFETKKYCNYLNKYKRSLEIYCKTGDFPEIVVEFDTKDDYKKIGKQVKPELEIISNRFQGKAAHADGYVYHQVIRLSEAIEKFQIELYEVVSEINKNIGSQNTIDKYELIAKDMENAVLKCADSLKDYKEKLGKRFIEYSKDEGYLE